MSTILHVEDESSVRFLYKEVFEELGYEVLQASSGEEALRMLRGKRPDIIILDLKMPGMGGRGFLEKFHKLKLQIPVVIKMSCQGALLSSLNTVMDRVSVSSVTGRPCGIVKFGRA